LISCDSYFGFTPIDEGFADDPNDDPIVDPFEDDDIDGVNALVGTWGLIESEEGVEISLTVTFNENLSGTIATNLSNHLVGETEIEYESFTWSTNGNKLTLIIDGETEISTYSISGNRLTMTDEDGKSTVLTRQ